MSPLYLPFISRLLQHALVFDDEGSDSARKLAAALSKGTYVASTSGQAEIYGRYTGDMREIYGRYTSRALAARRSPYPSP